jgi:uncharacterized protein YdeI (YjbR/CyaY-like superfamily)
MSTRNKTTQRTSIAKTNPKVDAHLSKAEKWQEEFAKLRPILLDSPLTEDFKWGKPCYTFQNSNLVIMYGLKESCALGFLKGVLLKDPKRILLKPGENSQSGRWVKFTSVQQITEMEPTLKAYILEAIEAEKAGLKVEFKAITNLKFPEELQNKLKKNPALNTAFKALTPGRQRAYNLFFSAPKQSATRESRIEKCLPKILAGKGMNDCVCGLSKKQPYCDGSHKSLEPKK